MGWVGFSLLLLYAVLVGGSWLGLYVEMVRVADLVLVAVALLIWLLVAWRRPDWRPRTSIWPTFVAPLLALGLAVVLSPFPRLGLEYLAWAILLVALYLLLVRILARPYARARIGGLLAAMALVLGVAYIAWSALLWVEWWDLVGELRLPPFRPAQLGMTWGSPSVVVVVQVLMVAAAAGGLGFATRGARVTVSALIAITAVMALISGSRSVWLSLAGATATIAVLALLHSRVDVRAAAAAVRHSRWLRYSIPLLLLVSTVVAVAFGPAMVERFASYGDGGRPVYWATALRMLADAPVTGLGPGTWMVRRIAYTEPGEVDFYQPHAHGQVVQTAAELGLVGLAAGVVAFACVGWLVVAAARGNHPVRRRWAWASGFGLVFLALDTVVDVHTIPTVALLVAIPIATLDATSERAIALPRRLRSPGRLLSRTAILALLVACLVSIGYLARAESVALSHQRAVQAADKGDWQGALQPAREVVSADPELAVYQVTAGLAAAGTGDWAAAEEAFETAVAIDGLPASWLGLAVARSELRRPAAEVEAALREALRLGEQQPAMTYAAGQVYDRLGLTAEADAAYALTLAEAPSLAADAAWQATIGPTRFAQLAETVIRAAPQVGWEVALMSGDHERARELASAHPDHEYLEAIIDAWDGDAAAVLAVQAGADLDPLAAGRLAWAARVSDRADRPEDAARYRRLMRLGPHYGPSTVNLQTSEVDRPRDDGLGTSTQYYGPYTYRRAAPLNLVVPGLRGLTVEDGAALPEARTGGD